MSYIPLLLLLMVQSSRPDLVRGELRAVERNAPLVELVSGLARDAWVGYGVPGVGDRRSGCRGVVDLVDGGRYADRAPSSTRPDETWVFLRVVGGQVEGVRTVTGDCRIDPGADTVYWATNVAVEDSVALLNEIVESRAASDLAEAALHAVAQHGNPLADRSLDAFAAVPWPKDLRERAVFWMGAARGEAGVRSLDALSKQGSETWLREKVAFALHVSDVPDATSILVRMARNDTSAEVRQKALFWLAQEAGDIARDTIVESVREDPEREVKKKALFALSQLPVEEGVPLLIEVAESHADPEIRKKAWFWLGQSGHPAALQLIERVLLERQ